MSLNFNSIHLKWNKAIIFNRAPQIALLLFTVYAVLTSYWQLISWELIGPTHAKDVATWIATDQIDVPPLLLRCAECTTFLQTRSYWHENYTPTVIFYRPLSLTWFWLQYRLFGPNHFEYWNLVSILIDVIFCGLFAMLIKDISNSWTIALLSILIFAGYRSDLFPGEILHYLGLPVVAPTLVAVTYWKDQPTLIADNLTVLSMLFALRAKWIPSLLAPLIGVFFKESCWIAYPLVFVLLASTGKLAKVPKWVYGGFIVCLAIPVAARYSAGMGLIGRYDIGTNQNAPVRYFKAVSSCFLASIPDGQWPSTLFAMAAYAALRLSRWKLLARVGLVLISAAILGEIEGSFNQTSAAVGAFMLLDPTMQLSNFVLAILFCCLFYPVLEQKMLRETAGKLIIFMLIAALPYVAATQILSHALHLCYAFQAAISAIAWVALFQFLELNLRKRLLLLNSRTVIQL